MSWRIVRRVQSSVPVAGGHAALTFNPADYDDPRIASIECRFLWLRGKFRRGANVCRNQHASRPCPPQPSAIIGLRTEP